MLRNHNFYVYEKTNNFTGNSFFMDYNKSLQISLYFTKISFKGLDICLSLHLEVSPNVLLLFVRSIKKFYIDIFI